VKNGSRIEAEAAVVGAIDLGAGQVRRQQIRRELDTVKVCLDPSGQGLDGAGLGDTGRTLDQQVPVGKQRDQQPLHQRVLTQDLPLDPAPQRLELRLNQVFGDIVAQGRALGLIYAWR
jgi:hypothetical protein